MWFHYASIWICYCSSPSTILSWMTIGKTRWGRKIGRLPHLKVLLFPTNLKLTICSVRFTYRQLSYWTFHYYYYYLFYLIHVLHSQPPVKLIASTSFQGHTITPTSQALLHEYMGFQQHYSMIEFPRTGGKKNKTLGKWKAREHKGEETRCFFKVWCGGNET